MLIFYSFFNFFFFFLSLLKSAEFTEMCPRGKGFVPTGESSYDVGGENYKGQNQQIMHLQHECLVNIQVKVWFALNRTKILWSHGSWLNTFNSILGRKPCGLWVVLCMAWDLEYIRLSDSGIHLTFSMSTSGIGILSQNLWGLNEII